MSLKVGVSNYPPYFKYEQIAFEEYICSEGTMCSLVNILSQKLRRKFHFVFPTDGGAGGVPMENGSWNGDIGLLQRKEVELVPGLAFTYDRFKVVDFSNPLQCDKIIFAIRSAKPLGTENAFFHPFQLKSWICILVSFFVCLIMLAILRHRKRMTKSPKTLGKDLISSAEMLTGVRDCRSINGNPAARVFYAISHLCMIILVLCYAAVLLSFLMAPIKELQIKTFEQLAQAAKSGKVKIAVSEKSFAYILLSSAKDGSLKDLADNIKHFHIDKQNYKSRMQLIEDGYAIINYPDYFRMEFDYYNKEKVFISDDGNFGNMCMGFMLQKNSKYKAKINWIVQRLTETGIYLKIKADFILKSQHEIQRQNSGKKKDENPSSLRPLSLSNFRVLFIMIAIGFLMSIAVLTLETYISKQRQLRL